LFRLLMDGVLLCGECVVSHSSHFPAVKNVRECLTLAVRGSFVGMDTLNTPMPCPLHHKLLIYTSSVQPIGGCGSQGVVRFEPLYTSILAQPSNSLTEGVLA